MPDASSSSSSSPNLQVVVKLLPIVSVVFVTFLVIGLAMPVLPLHVHNGLGLGTFAVGLIAGAQFAASLISRFWSGQYADSRGAKRAVVAGLIIAVLAGGLYYLSLRVTGGPKVAAAVLLFGRALLGAGESFVITGALSWGMTLAGAAHTGKVIAWIGMAMYVAFAAGAPLGTVLYGTVGFVGIALATSMLPLLSLLMVATLRPVAPTTVARPRFTAIIGAVWQPGVGLAFSSIGFGAVTTFIALLYASRGWPNAWLAFTGFSTAFVVARVFLGHLPDWIGGAKVATVSVLIEAAGQALIWLAPGPMLALTGTVLTGLGYSLVYPGFGVEAVRRAPPQSRGLAMGAYTAFLDLALGLASPVLGLIASRSGIGSVFLASALAISCATIIGIKLCAAPSQIDYA
jgi:MFS family permease